jgi:DNA-binding FrmR family transcriptional regulator
MENNQSLLKQFTSVVGQVGAILNRLDIDSIDRPALKLIGTIKHLLADTRLDIRDWEMSEHRAEMEANGTQAIERLEQARAAILLASEWNIFTAIEIAEISARFDVFIRELKK